MKNDNKNGLIQHLRYPTMIPLNSQVNNPEQILQKNYTKNFVKDIVQRTDQVTNQSPSNEKKIFIAEEGVKNDFDIQKTSISIQLINKFTTALGGKLEQDFDNEVLTVQKQIKRRNTYFTMANLMEKGDLTDIEKNNDFDEASDGGNNATQEEFSTYKYLYEVAEIDQEAFYAGNQLLEPQIKNDFELLKQYADSYPLLDERKLIMLLMTSVSYFCQCIITHRIFDNLILFIIVLNSMMLAMDDPKKETTDPIILFIEEFFLWAYGTEAALKIIGMGFIFNTGSYLRDTWNILDFTIVVTSFISAFSGGSGGSLASLRALRILRPLRTISTIKALKEILTTLFAAINDMVNTIIILIFFFMIFAIGGVQLFMGLLKQRCFRPETGEPHEDDIICGRIECPEEYICGKMIENPNWGVTNFDNLSYSFLMVFQCVTMEGWTEIMYDLFDAFTELVAVYFILMIFIGAFFLLNLTLAVIKAKFSASQDGIIEEEEYEYKMDLVILQNFRRMHRMYIKRNMFKTMQNNREWGPIYSGQSTDIATLKDQLEFTWEQLMKKAKQKQLQVKQKIEQQKKAIELQQNQGTINKTIRKNKKKIRNILEKFQKTGKLNKIMPTQKLIYHFDPSKFKDNYQLALDNKSQAKSSLKQSNNIATSSLQKEGVIFIRDEFENEDDEKLKQMVGNQQKSRSNSDYQSKIVNLRQESPQLAPQDNFMYNTQNSLSLQNQTVQQLPMSKTNGFQQARQKKQVSFMGMHQLKNKLKQAPTDKDEELDKLFGKSPRQSRQLQINEQKAKKNQLFSILSLHQKKVKASYINNPLSNQTTQINGVNNSQSAHIPLQTTQIVTNRKISARQKVASRSGLRSRQKQAENSDLDISDNNITYKQNVNKKTHHTKNSSNNFQGMDIVSISNYDTNNSKQSEIFVDRATSKQSRRGRALSAGSSIGLSDDSDFGEDKEVDIDELTQQWKNQTKNKKLQCFQKSPSQSSHDVKSSDQSDKSEVLEKTRKKSLKLMKAQKDEWHIGADEEFRKKKAEQIQKQIQFQEAEQYEKQKNEELQKREAKKHHHNSHNHHNQKVSIRPSRISVDNQGKGKKSISATPIITPRNQSDNETPPSPCRQSKLPQIPSQVQIDDRNSLKDADELTPSDMSEESEQENSDDDQSKQSQKESGQLTAKQRKEQLDQSNVFNWKLKVNIVEFKSESQDEVLIHQLMECERKLLDSEIQNMNNKTYKMKYKLQKKREEKPQKRKKTKLQIQEEQRIKQQEKRKRIQREQKRRITANSIRRHLGLPESPFLKPYDKKLIPISHHSTIHRIVNPIYGFNNGSRQPMKSNTNAESQFLLSDPNISKKDIKDIDKKKDKKKDTKKNFEDDENHQTLVKFLEEPNYREARKIVRLKNVQGNKQEEEDDKEKNKDDEEKKEEDINLRYLLLGIKRKDFLTGLKMNSIWSGKQIIMSVGTEKHQNKFLRLLSTDRTDIQIFIKGWFGVVIILHKHFKNFVNGSFFNNLLTLAVFINTAVLAMDGSFSDPQTLDVMETLNNVFTYAFIVELAMKLIALGPKGYVAEVMNIFDGVIVMLSIFELIFFSGGNKAVSAFRAIRIFRTFRVLRVTRLLRGLQFMGKIIQVVSLTVDKFMWVALLMLLFIFIYSLLGMQIYGNEFNFTDDRQKIRQNFSGFQMAFLAIFQVMTMENWQQILHLAVSSDVNKFLSSLYLISWLFIGNFIFLNLFISILLDGFTVDDEEVDELDDGEDVYEIDVGNDLLLAGQDISQMKFDFHDQGSAFKPISTEQEENQKKTFFFERLPTEEEIKIQQEINASKKHVEKPLFDKIECNQSVFIFSKKNWIRIIFYKIVQNPQFENLILALIIISSLKLVVDSYFSDGSAALAVSEELDYFFNAAFGLEALMKIIAFGFILDENSYLTDTWSQLDFFIVVTSLIDMSFSNVDLPFIKILRLLRILRPLRFISHNINMKIVVIALLESVSAIFNVLIVVVLIWLMFAILGMSLLGGRMGYCSGIGDFYNVSRTECYEREGAWKIWKTNFDNMWKRLLLLYTKIKQNIFDLNPHILNAMNTLYIISSLEGWPDYMFQSIDSNQAEYGPSKGNYIVIAYFYIIYILIGSFFLMNLFVGVIFLKFNEASKNERVCSLFITDEQSRWIEFQQMIIGVKAEFAANKIPESKFRAYCWHLATNQIFDLTIIFCIILNIVTMGMVYDGSPIEYDNILEDINLFFTVVFIFEASLKIIAFGIKGYLISGWNRFDFFVVLSSILDIIMSAMGSGISFLRVGPQLARVMRVLRVSRLLKLVKSMKGLHKIIETLIFSLPSLINVGALLLLVFFIFAVLGVFMFRRVTEGQFITEYANFRNFGAAMLTLFRCATGEDWGMIMFDLSRTAPDCEEGKTCGTEFATVYFLFFVMFVQFIMLNLFILIIIQYFEDYNMKEGNPLETFNEQLEVFRLHWSGYSKYSNGEKIKQKDIISFVTNLPEPLGYSTKDFKKLQGKELHDYKAGIYRDVQSWNLTEYIYILKIFSDGEGNIVFNEMLYACMKKAYGCHGFSEADQELKSFINKLEMETKMQIYEAKKQLVSQQRQQAFAQEASQIQGRNVNPMVLFIFTSMAFKCMRNYKFTKGQAPPSESDSQTNSFSESDQSSLLNEDTGKDKKIFQPDQTISEEDEDLDEQDDEVDELQQMNDNDIEAKLQLEARMDSVTMRKKSIINSTQSASIERRQSIIQSQLNQIAELSSMRRPSAIQKPGNQQKRSSISINPFQQYDGRKLSVFGLLGQQPAIDKQAIQQQAIARRQSIKANPFGK